MIDQNGCFCAVTGTEFDQVKGVVAICKRPIDRVRLRRKYLVFAAGQVILRQLHYLLKQPRAFVVVKIFGRERFWRRREAAKDVFGELS